jgi:hypothetical protein
MWFEIGLSDPEGQFRGLYWPGPRRSKTFQGVPSAVWAKFLGSLSDRSGVCCNGGRRRFITLYQSLPLVKQTFSNIIKYHKIANVEILHVLMILSTDHCWSSYIIIYQYTSCHLHSFAIIWYWHILTHIDLENLRAFGASGAFNFWGPNQCSTLCREIDDQLLASHGSHGWHMGTQWLLVGTSSRSRAIELGAASFSSCPSLKGSRMALCNCNLSRKKQVCKCLQFLLNLRVF